MLGTQLLRKDVAEPQHASFWELMTEAGWMGEKTGHLFMLLLEWRLHLLLTCPCGVIAVSLLVQGDDKLNDKFGANVVECFWASAIIYLFFWFIAFFGDRWFIRNGILTVIRRRNPTGLDETSAGREAAAIGHLWDKPYELIQGFVLMCFGVICSLSAAGLWDDGKLTPRIWVLAIMTPFTLWVVPPFHNFMMALTRTVSEHMIQDFIKKMQTFPDETKNELFWRERSQEYKVLRQDLIALWENVKFSKLPDMFALFLVAMFNVIVMVQGYQSQQLTVFILGATIFTMCLHQCFRALFNMANITKMCQDLDSESIFSVVYNFYNAPMSDQQRLDHRDLATYMLHFQSGAHMIMNVDYALVARVGIPIATALSSALTFLINRLINHPQHS